MDKIINTLELLILSNEILKNSEPIDIELRELMDVALLKSGTSYPTVKGMK